MKSTRNLATTILVALGATLAVGSVNAQPTPAQLSDAATSPSAKTSASDCGEGHGQGMHKGSGMGQGQGMRQGKGKNHGKNGKNSEMSKLMTPEERSEMRTKMQAANTPEERQALRTSMRAEMQKRAKEKGITLPEYQGGRKHQHGQHAS